MITVLSKSPRTIHMIFLLILNQNQRFKGVSLNVLMASALKKHVWRN
jgi:hypothetical protein